jgi:hypothetical protein
MSGKFVVQWVGLGLGAEEKVASPVGIDLGSLNAKLLVLVLENGVVHVLHRRCTSQLLGANMWLFTTHVKSFVAHRASGMHLWNCFPCFFFDR